MDLLDFFRGVHTWPQLYRLLSRLPRDSHYRGDQSIDEELAKRIVAMDEPKSTKRGDADESAVRPTTTQGFTREVELLMLIADWIQKLNSTLIAVNLPKGKSPPRVQPVPRPLTAIEYLRMKREENDVEVALHQLLSFATPIFDVSDDAPKTKMKK